jgi:hypothetical protein
MQLFSTHKFGLPKGGGLGKMDTVLTLFSGEDILCVVLLDILEASRLRLF